MAVSVALLVLAACSESRAARRVRKADALAHNGRYEDAITVLSQVVSDFPDTRAARDARKQIVLYRGLLEAELKKDRRRAKDEMIEIGRSLFHYYEKRRRYPESLDDLGREISVPSIDPWGRPYRYRLARGSRYYRLECLGKDGQPGGTGDDQDLMVVNGEFTRDLPWEDR